MAAGKTESVCDGGM